MKKNTLKKSYMELYKPEKSFCNIFRYKKYHQNEDVVLTEKNAYIQNIYLKIYKMIYEIAYPVEDFDERILRIGAKNDISYFIINVLYKNTFSFWASNKAYYSHYDDYSKWINSKDGSKTFFSKKNKTFDNITRTFEGHDNSIKRIVLLLNEETKPISIVVTINEKFDTNIFNVTVKKVKYNFNEKNIALLKDTLHGNKNEDLKYLSIENDRFGKIICKKKNLSIAELKEYIEDIIKKY